MLERDRYPEGVPCWVDTMQPDLGAATAFYGDVFGWRFVVPAGGDGAYLIATLDGFAVAAVGTAPDAAATPAWWTYIAVDEVDDAAGRVRAAGGAVLMGPHDVLDAGRMAVCTDPAGAEFRIWQAKTDIGAQVVNEPGTWNGSDLRTPDVAGATAFYGAAFGWEADPVDVVGTGPTMLRVPGYGDYLESINPGVHKLHADLGAPPGFTDAIGWMEAVPADSAAGRSPHWAVTFSVADTDATVAAAEKGGAEVLVAPFDAGPVRSATLRDPQGATFGVRTFTPD